MSIDALVAFIGKSYTLEVADQIDVVAKHHHLSVNVLNENIQHDNLDVDRSRLNIMLDDDLKIVKFYIG